MFYLGKFNSLRALRNTVHGMFLGDDGDLEVLLPKKYVPLSLKPQDFIDVFLYIDSEDRIVATVLTPKILLHEFAVLEVTDVTTFGAFLNWGLDKDLFLPFAEQKGKAQKGDKVLVYLNLDEKTDRLFASAKITTFADKNILVKEGEAVDLLIGRKSELGYQVVINNRYLGLIFLDKVFQPLAIGDKLKGYIEQIREDGKIDVSLQKQGYGQVMDSQNIVLKKLQENQGVLYITDKSDPKLIIKEFNMSKKVFKKCLGALYKQRKIHIEEDRIVLS
jgi:uncharacterized protein